MTIDEPVLCYDDKNRTKFQESKSKPYTITLFIIVFLPKVSKRNKIKYKESCSKTLTSKSLKNTFEEVIFWYICRHVIRDFTKNKLLHKYYSQDFVHRYPTAILQKTSQKSYYFEYMNFCHGFPFFMDLVLTPYPSLHAKCCLAWQNMFTNDPLNNYANCFLIFCTEFQAKLSSEY